MIDKEITERQREMLFMHMWKRVFIFWEVEWASQWVSTSVCVCVFVFTQACLCAWAVPRPGLGGLSEISCKRITDHASLAYWFTAKNTYTYTQNLLLPCSSFFICLSFSHSLIQTHNLTHIVHFHTHTTPSSMGSLGVQGVQGLSLYQHTVTVCFIRTARQTRRGTTKVPFVLLVHEL